MKIHSFLHQSSQTFTHLLIDEHSQQCALIDPVLDFNLYSGHTSTNSIDKIIDFIQSNQLKLLYIFETHAHADHLSSASYVKSILGGKTLISQDICTIQSIFKPIFNLDDNFTCDGSQFDILLEDGDQLNLGAITLTAWNVAGHTPADMAYLASDQSGKLVVFIGDTLFAPDVGTARCDFPKGDPALLYRSIQRLLSLPDDTLLYLCHDYPNNGRDYLSHTDVKTQKKYNIHVKDGISQDEFVRLRTQRDKSLSVPQLIIPSIQVNIMGGQLPKAEKNGIQYLKIPLNTF